MGTRGMKKSVIIISTLVVAIVGSVIYISWSRRENMIKELEERLGLSRNQLKGKSNEELAAMLESVNGK